MKFRILSPAADDLAKAVEYYESQILGLGYDFLAEYETTIARICRFPKAWAQISPNHRRCLMRRFPFAILYAIENEEILVSGIMNLHLNPDKHHQRIN